LSEKNEEKISEELDLDEEQVWDIVKFANSFYSQNGGIGVFTPDLINDAMKRITMNPISASEESLLKALKDPKNNELKLQGYAEDFENQSQPYKRMIRYLGNMLSFDMTYSCTNVKDAKEYKEKKYKKDLAVFEDFLEKFNAKKEFKTVARQLIRQETFFCVLRDDGENYVLQELPSTYCKITGRWESGTLFSFDFNWFWNSGVDIDMYPDSFKRKYNDAFLGEATGYKPSRPITSRGRNDWVYWVDLSPIEDKAWAWKFTPEISTRVPFFSPLFQDLILQNMVRELQKNQYMSGASKILFGEVPLLNKTVKGASIKDAISIDPNLLGKFLALVKTALQQTAVKVAAAPLENVQGISFESDNGMYKDYMKSALANSGLNTNLFFSPDVKQNAIETQLSLDTDIQLMQVLYPYFEDFVNYYANANTKHYKFKVRFEGAEFHTDRKERLSSVKDLANLGIVLPHKLAAAVGMSPKEFKAQMEEQNATDFIDMLTPIGSGFQSSEDGDGEKGRPKKDSSDLSDSGAQNRGDGSNVAKGKGEV